MQTKDTDYSFRLEYTNKQGKREKIYNAISYDPHTQVLSGNWKFETIDENGEVIDERIRPLKMRQTYRQEMKYLLELTGYEIVNVMPQPHAGGSFAVTAWNAFSNPVAVETIAAEAGIDIGGTLIGMHLRRVAVPVRTSEKQIGEAIVLCARTRPKYIGGPRAMYQE